MFSKLHRLRFLDILREPADALAVALPHNDGTHEDFDWSDALEGYFALTS